MNASWTEYVTRSLQKAFADAFSACDVFYGGQLFNPSFYDALCVHNIDGPRWTPGRDGFREGTVAVSVGCFVAKTADVHRLDEIAGAAAAAIDRAQVRVYDYPSGEPSALGWVRMREAEIERIVLSESISGAAGDGEVPLRHASVMTDGIVGLKI